MRCATPASALPAAVAVLLPVVPAAACSTSAISSESPSAWPVESVATSTRSVMPAAGVHVCAEVKLCALTTRVLAVAVMIALAGGGGPPPLALPPHAAVG